ncbi:MAG: endonuclease domain-containing protein [Alphaproteobacteria bacterium]|nr:endonuclease domain-containing protein [Alphaproteobacteria bacterium]
MLISLPLVGREDVIGESQSHKGGGRMRTRLQPFAIERARQLRRDATNAEAKLWWRLRALRVLGYHFRRQAPFRSYILDFVEHNRRVVIELDGDQHCLPENARRDAIRDRMLESQRYLVLRLANRDVLEDIEAVADHVIRILEHRPPTRTASRSDLPTRGR